MATLTIISFIKKIINKSYIISATKLDNTIKALININFNNKELINYLNILRVIYYIKRLKYYNFNIYNKTLSKLILY